MKTRTKVIISIIAVLLTVALITTIVLLSYGDGIRAKIRNIEIENNGIDVKTTLSSFDNPSYRKDGNTVYFEGSKKFDLKQISNIENLSKNEIESITNSTVKFKYSYDVENNIITLSATAQFVDGSLEVEQLRGVGFINDNNEIDAVINVEGEGVLLSEMRANGMIENCGWFSRLIKNVVKAVIVTATVAVVAAATVGLAVATAGLAAPAMMAAGFGLVTANVVGASVGLVTGSIVLNTWGKAAIQAGTAFAEAIGEGIEQVVDKISNDVLALRWQGVEYAFVRLTVAICNTIKYGGYRITLINSNESCIRISSTAIPYVAAVAFLRVAKTLTEINNNIKSYYSLYHYSQDAAYAVAQAAGNGAIPKLHAPHSINQSTGEPNQGTFYAHYHVGQSARHCGHAFFGLPIIN